MRCFKAKRELSLYLDGELKANRESALFSHLEKCETCRIEKEKMAAVSVILKRPKEIQPSLQFLNKVIRNIEEYDKRKHVFLPSLYWLRPVLSGFGLILIFVLSTYFGQFLATRNQVENTQIETLMFREFNKIMNIAVFADVPDESFAAVYKTLLKGEEK
jgi:predicted anti-sigma-YlaC factor YlaD